MTKNELIAALATQTELPKTKVSVVIDALVDTVTAKLIEGDEVVINGLGTFKVKERAERNGRNPATGEAIVIQACNVASFQVSATLKKAVK
jgi:nucleoid DNA-binding protein